MQIWLDKLRIAWDGVRDAGQMVVERTREIGDAGRGFCLAEWNEILRNVANVSLIMALTKRYWHIVLPSFGVVVVGTINLAVMFSGNQSTRLAADTYSIFCLECQHTQHIDRSYYEVDFHRNGESDYVSDSDHKNCGGCKKPFAAHALVNCPVCNKEFVMGRTWHSDFPRSITERGRYCPHDHTGYAGAKIASISR